MATLTAEQIQQLETEGYLLVKGALDTELDIEPVEREFATILDRVAHRLKREGRISDTHDDLPFEDRFIAVATDSPEPMIPNFEIALPNGGFTAKTPINCGPATFNFLRSPRILDLVEPLIGGEIFCNPVQHTRIKLPPSVHADSRSGNLTDATQWHQDQGVVLAEADHTQTITIWAAMTDADEENGCLVYEQRSHRDGLGFHCPANAPNKKFAVAIPDEWIDESRSLPVPAQRGDILIHLPLTKHGSLKNTSNRIRWSFDLRYHPVGQPTGRPMFPGFVARSRAHPETELPDHVAWKALWEDARTRILAGPMPEIHRWNTDAAACA
jgi:phytanoyl-CoA hydroxylase